MVKVSVVKCETYNPEEVFEAVKKAIEGIGLELPKTGKVLIKPNVLAEKPPESGITTHPSVLEAVCRLIQGCEITVGDSSGTGAIIANASMKALETSGLKAAGEKYGRVISFDKEGVATVQNPEGKVLKEINIAKPVAEAEYIINLPKMKTHVFTKYTGAIKNLYGCVPGGRKQIYHLTGKNEEGFCRLLVDIHESIKPKLTIMDAVVGLEGNGPGAAGTPRKAGLILASENSAALDIVASEIMGFEPMEVFTNKDAVERGIVDRDQIEVVGDMKHFDFKRPNLVEISPLGIFTKIYQSLQLAKPVLEEEKCIKCGICSKVCPVAAINLNPYPDFDYDKCIRCYCCHENCPENAIELKNSRFAKTARKIKRFIWRR